MTERRARRKHTLGVSIPIVMEGMRGDQAGADDCRWHGITPPLHYKWRDKILAFDDEVFKDGNTKRAQSLSGNLQQCRGPSR